MKQLLGATIAVATLALGCGSNGGAGKPCNSNADCTGGLVCNLGACAASSAGGGAGGGVGAGGGAGGGAGAGYQAGGGSATGGGGGSGPCLDNDGDGFSTCGTMGMNGMPGTADCNDNASGGASIHPGATETANGIDDDCDGIIDNHVDCADYDMDGYPFCTSVNEQCANFPNTVCDCNDDVSQVGPNAVEDPMNQIDDNCNGQVDEALTSCDSTATGNTAQDFAKAIGLCNFVTGASAHGDNSARSVRVNFGDNYHKLEGDKMALLSSGKAVDQFDQPGYEPQVGTEFGTTDQHPFYTTPKCGTPGAAPAAQDMSEIDLTIKVPQNAQGFTFNFAFFSAEYPEWVCTSFNDRFIVLSDSKALDPTKLPADECKNGICQISYDTMGQPVTVNNGFFSVCDGPNCTAPVSKLSKTGYSDTCQVLCDASGGGGSDSTGRANGGGTGWLGTTAPVKPGETLTLKFIVFDEGDDQLDSAALIDNFKWVLTPVTAPVTVVPPGLN
ncbi:MAG: choice-of-anchor L domain-containing protein [Myxococcaceae bacterium]